MSYSEDKFQITEVCVKTFTLNLKGLLISQAFEAKLSLQIILRVLAKHHLKHVQYFTTFVKFLVSGCSMKIFIFSYKSA